MPNTIILKKSSVANKIPANTDLVFGELAINYNDGRLYYKNSNNNINFINNGGTLTNTLSIATSTVSTSTTTGALVVSGGVGIGGSLWVGGDDGNILKTSYESVSKNLKSYSANFSYSGTNLTSIVYTTPSGNIVKSLNYSGNTLTSVVLSGATPNGITLTKTLTYTNNQLTSISYS